MKKILALLMAIMMIVGCLAINVGASEATATQVTLNGLGYSETFVMDVVDYTTQNDPLTDIVYP